MSVPLRVGELDAADMVAALPRLAAILHACVAGGASVGFVQPFTSADAAAWWQAKVLPAVAAGERRLIGAWWAGELAGTAQLDLATMPNQRHRADVAKVLVDPALRRRGLARAMMARIEAIALAEGRRLLVLDTVADSPARHLYAALGYRLAGEIPGYARAPGADRLEATAVMFKPLPG